jgi:hypothetical protein
MIGWLMLWVCETTLFCHYLKPLPKHRPHIFICEAAFRAVRVHGVLFHPAAVIGRVQNLVVIFMLNHEVHDFAGAGPDHTEPGIPQGSFNGVDIRVPDPPQSHIDKT